MEGKAKPLRGSIRSPIALVKRSLNLRATSHLGYNLCYTLQALFGLLIQLIDVFTVRDLRQRSGELLRHAESGTLALINRHGRPALLAIPFDQYLLEHGVHRATTRLRRDSRRSGKSAALPDVCAVSGNACRAHSCPTYSGVPA